MARWSDPSARQAVIERLIEALKYQGLYGHDISDGIDLAAHAQDFRVIDNAVRPYEALATTGPLEATAT